MEQTVDDNYVCNLDPASIKKAKDELNENPDDRLAAVQALRDWIKEQPHIKCPQTDTIFLLRFIRWAKFSQLRAREKLENYLDLRNVLPSLYTNVDSHDDAIHQILKAGYLIICPVRAPNGCTILTMKVNSLTKLKFNNPTYLKAFTAVFEYVTKQDMNQVNGFILFIDYTGATLSDLVKFCSPEASKMLKDWIKSSPGRFKAAIHYNCGLLMETMMTFLKVVLPKKHVARITVHDTMESVYKIVPKEYWPSDYLPDDYVGPNAGSLEQCIKNTISAISEKEFHDSLLYRTSKEFGVDFSKKPKCAVTDHFRKLTVD